jgi:hypothetical protein
MLVVQVDKRVSLPVQSGNGRHGELLGRVAIPGRASQLGKTLQENGMNMCG